MRPLQLNLLCRDATSSTGRFVPWTHLSSKLRVSVSAVVCFYFLSLFCCFETAFSQQANTVTVSMLSNASVSGSLSSGDEKQVVVATKNGPVAIPAGEISQVKFANKRELQPPPVELLLADGSRIFCDRLAGKGTAFQLTDTANVELQLPPKSLRAARLRPIGSELLDEWQSAIRETKETDAVIVLRPSGSLDRINGVIVQVQEGSVSFDLDGQTIEIPIEKLVGLVWFQRAQEDRVKPAIEVSLTNNTVWMSESLALKGDMIEIRTALGQSLSIALSKVSGLNYASANIRWLSEESSLEAVADRSIEFKTPMVSLDRALAPRFVTKGKNVPTALPADKDLYFPGPGRFLFRVPEGFTSLQSRVERSDNGTQRSDLTIEVFQDDQKVASQPLPFGVDFVELQVALQPGKKTWLAVVCASKLMIGTEVTWKQPRLKR